MVFIRMKNLQPLLFLLALLGSCSDNIEGEIIKRDCATFQCSECREFPNANVEKRLVYFVRNKSTSLRKKFVVKVSYELCPWVEDDYDCQGSSTIEQTETVVLEPGEEGFLNYNIPRLTFYPNVFYKCSVKVVGSRVLPGK